MEDGSSAGFSTDRFGARLTLVDSIEAADDVDVLLGSKSTLTKIPMVDSAALGFELIVQGSTWTLISDLNRS